MKKAPIGRSLSALLFLALIFGGLLTNALWRELARGELAAQRADALSPLSLAREARDAFVSGVRGRQRLIELNGSIARAMDMRSFYAGEYGIYLDDDMVIVSAYGRTSTDYETDQTVAFHRFLAAHGIPMLYVQLPNKYLDDAVLAGRFGVRSYCNDNLDRLLGRLRAADVPVLDIREKFTEDGLDIAELFYRTDHHWTVPAGFLASRHIAAALNESCGLHIDLSLYDEANFSFLRRENCWLGEQGQKLAQSYVGLDDFTEIKPNFETHYRFTFDDGSVREGSFEDFIDESRYALGPDSGLSWYYSYQTPRAVNHDVPDGKVLLLCDSFGHVLHPFLSLGVREIDSLVLRDLDESFDLRQYILDGGYDAVLICYSPSMVGAHVDPESSNYRMFDFR